MDFIDNALDELNIKSVDSRDTDAKLIEEMVEAGIDVDIKKKVTLESMIIKEEDREIAVRKRLIPKKYTGASFDIDKITENISNQAKMLGQLYKVVKFNEYADVCNSIISTLRTGNLPNKSYLIGAPNGFGKTSFANECIMLMSKHSMQAVPYVSLFELAEIKVAEEHRLMDAFSYRTKSTAEGNRAYTYIESKEPDFIKSPEIITGNYSWSEYINAECVFCYFTSVSSKNLESRVLQQLLNIRATKGLPTIVMISTSIDPYIMDRTLKEQVWDEILSYNDNKNDFDRVSHVSCYKVRVSNFK